MFFCRRLLPHVVFSASSTARVQCSFSTAAVRAFSGAPFSRLPSTRNGHRQQHQTRKSEPIAWEEYINTRQDLRVRTAFTISQLCSLAQQAATLIDYKLIMSDILLHIHQKRHGSRIMFPLKCLICSTHFRHLARSDAFILVDELVQCTDNWAHFPPQYFGMIISSICTLGQPNVVDNALLELLHPELLRQLRSLAAPSPSAPYNPPMLVRSSFTYIRDLLRVDNTPKALEIFQTLLEKGLLEALPELSPAEDLNIIVYLTLARASMRWDWRNSALGLLHEIVSTRAPFNAEPLAVVNDTLFDILALCLAKPRAHELRRCVHLMQALHTTHSLPDSAIHQLYIAAHKGRFPEIGYELFNFVSRPDIINERLYPPPPPQVCRWLLEALQETSAASHLGRILVSHIVDEEMDLPVHDRAPVIVLAATSGYGALAKRLWQRFSTGPDALHVTGNSSVCLRMISVMKRVQTNNRELAARAKSPQQFLEYKRRSIKAKDFLHLILGEFARALHPLQKASHHSLTSLARANFMVGRPTTAMHIFQILFIRNDTPDFFDINVALKALAEKSPRAAARMIVRILEKGVKPPGATFGTVMHQALQQDDQVVFLDLLHKASEACVELTPRTMISMLRSSAVTACKAEPHLQARKFLGILSIVKGMTDKGLTMSPHLGKFLVYTALRANQVRMAYRFWSLVLLPHAQWDDVEHAEMRTTLANRITDLHRQGDNSLYRTKVMLGKLGRLHTRAAYLG